MFNLSARLTEKIVLGTAGLAGLWGAINEKESIRTVLIALEMGICYFDTAPAYAEAQAILSRALKEWRGAPPFVSTKVGKLKSMDPGVAICNYSPASLLNSIEESRILLNRDVLDLVFLHDPIAMKPEEMLPAIEFLQTLQSKGVVNQIGIGGHYGREFKAHVQNNGFTNYMGFNRFNLVNQIALKEEYTLLGAVGMEIWQASPLYMGLLGRKYDEYMAQRPQWIPENDYERAVELKQNCKLKGYDLTGLALNFVMQCKQIDKLVLGACNSEELIQSISFLEDEKLREEAIFQLSRLNIKTVR